MSKKEFDCDFFVTFLESVISTSDALFAEVWTEVTRFTRNVGFLMSSLETLSGLWLEKGQLLLTLFQSCQKSIESPNEDVKIFYPITIVLVGS